MSQSGAVPPVHSRRHRPEMNQNNANEPITAARFGETEWEARDVRINILHCLCLEYLCEKSHLFWFFIFIYAVTKTA